MTAFDRLYFTICASLPQGFFNRVFYLFGENWKSFIKGAGTTILIALVGTAIGCLIGLLCGVIKTVPLNPGNNKLKYILMKTLRVIINIYVEVFRGTPMMVQSMVIYYGLRYTGIELSMWFAAFLIVSVNTGAYMTETVRGGIDSIDPGQTEGAKAIGMNHFKTMIYVVMPQTLRNIMPQIGNNLIINIKDTSVLNVISTVELYFVSKSLAGSYYTYFEVYAITLVMYLVMTVTCAYILRRIERKMDGADNYELATQDTLAYTSGLHNYPSKNKKGRDRYGR